MKRIGIRYWSDGTHKREKPTAARYDAKMADKERNCHENLILLCGDHHKMIDDQAKNVHC